MDETLHTGGARLGQQQPHRIEIHLAGQHFVQVTGRIVRDRREMNHGVHARHSLRDHCRVTNVTTQALKTVAPLRIFRRPFERLETCGRVEQQIQHAHLVSCRQQVRGQPAAHITHAARD